MPQSRPKQSNVSRPKNGRIANTFNSILKRFRLLAGDLNRYQVSVPGPLPEYYTSLGPFRDAFANGCPALMYHKLGPRPRATRLKGLYVGARLFERQMEEFSAAGYKTILFSELAHFPATRGAVVLTFDDGFANTLTHGLGPMAARKFSAIQYLVADRLGQLNDWEMREGEAPARLMEAAQIRDWMAAGHSIGAHTLTHPHLTQVSAARAREEIASSKKKLEDLFGVPIREFCYPYGDWSPAIREEVVRAGYTVACTTERGINGPEVDGFGYKRYMARYASRNWRWLGSLFRGALGAR